jgi:hypothetical protein
MKKITIIPFLLLVLLSCSSSDNSPAVDDVHELAIRQRMSGSISQTGEVDWYYFRAVESNNILTVRCTSETLRPDVDLLVTVYEVDDQGNKVAIYADHAPEDGTSPASLTLNVYIDRPKDIYISVRDLMDDDMSDNPYYIFVDFASAPEGNDNFSQATTLTVNSDICPSDAISSIGDIDCYQFVSSGGVYDLVMEYSPFPDTEVQLTMDLYDGEGNLVESISNISTATSHMIHYLPAGDYYVNVADYGRNHFDTASTYQICVTSVDAAEAHENDDSEAATIVGISEYDHDYDIEGDVDYLKDEDWYRLTMPAVASGFRVLNVTFASDENFEYQIHLLDLDLNPMMSHSYRGGASSYQTQIKLEGDDDYFLMIQAASGNTLSEAASYEATVRAVNVLDAAEVAPNENDTIETADPLVPTNDPALATEGKIGYREDIDWYSVTIPAHASPQILEVFFEADVSQVEYDISIIGNQVEEKLTNLAAATSATNLKTAVRIPSNGDSAVYSIKVSDYQDDDGDDVTYSIRVDLKDIPGNLPAVANGTPPFGSVIEYYSEALETDTPNVELQYNAVTREYFGYDADLLDFSNAVIQADVPENGLTTVTLPWVAGYVDFQGDQDWFQIDFSPLDASDDWYYDISVELYAPASDVEYVWKFYPDRNDNEELADRISNYDGYIACAGDTDINAATVDMTTPASGEDQFWVGDAWEGPAYFSISDFNYLEDEAGNENPIPDDDWGEYDSAPYYYRVTLVYHPGESYPEE